MKEWRSASREKEGGGKEGGCSLIFIFCYPTLNLQ